MVQRGNAVPGRHSGTIEGCQRERCFFGSDEREDRPDGRSDRRSLLRRCIDGKARSECSLERSRDRRSQRCTWACPGASRSKRRKAAVLRECAHRLGDRTAGRACPNDRWPPRPEDQKRFRSLQSPAPVTETAKLAALAGASGACRRDPIATPRYRSQATRGLAAMPAPFCFWGRAKGRQRWRPPPSGLPAFALR